MKRTISLKAVAILLVVTVVSLGSAYFLYGFQKRRNVTAFLHRADRARDAKEAALAAKDQETATKELANELKYLEIYIWLAPKDSETRARLAHMLADLARNHKDRVVIYPKLERAVLENPDDAKLRRKLIGFYILLGRPKDAADHLETLYNQSGKKDAAVAEELARLHEARGEPKEAGRWYATSIAQDPKRVTSYVGQARLLRRLDDADTADKRIEAMIEANSSSSQARIERVRYWRDFHSKTKLDRMRQEMKGLLKEHADDNADVLLLAAAIEAEADNAKQAEAYLRRGMKNPKFADVIAFHRELARLQLRDGKTQDALRTLRAVIQKMPPTSIEYWMTIELMLEAGDRAEARKLVDAIRRDEPTAALIDYLNGRLLMAQERWLEAAALLDKARQDRLAAEEIKPHIHLYLARCHGRMGNYDRMLEYAGQSLKFDQGWLPGLMAQADAFAALRRIDAALQIYDKVSVRHPGARLAAVRLRELQNFTLPADQRDWSRALKDLDNLPPNLRNEPDAIVLRAQALVGQNKRAEALKVLEAGVLAHPRRVSLWVALAEATAGGGDDQAVERILNRAEGKDAAGDQIELRVLRAGLLWRKDQKAARDLLTRAEKHVSTLKDAAGKPIVDEQVKWLRALANFYLAVGELDGARNALDKVTQMRRDDHDAWSNLFDVVTMMGNMAEVRRVVGELRKVEGPEGVRWRHGEAMLLAMSGQPEEMKRAREYLSEAMKRRSSWGPPYALDGKIAEAEGNIDLAIDRYRTALQNGASALDVLGRLVRLLIVKGDYKQAQVELSNFRDLVPRVGELNRLSVLTQLRLAGDREKAVEIALKHLPRDSRDFRNLLLRGQALWAAGKVDEAEREFRQARLVGERDPEPYVTLVAFYAGRDHKKAEEVIALARKNLPAERVRLALSSCFEALNRIKEAEHELKEAERAQPNDPLTLRSIGSFYLRRGQLKEARPHLEKLMNLSGRQGEFHAIWARRMLALGLAMTGDYQATEEALRLLDRNFKGRAASPDDQRARALILARRPGDRRQAIKDLEIAFARVKPSPDEEFFLATLQVANQEWDKGKSALEKLLREASGNNPVYLVYYLQQLLERNEFRAAEQYMAKLHKAEPASLRTVALQARLNKGLKKDKEDVIGPLKKYADKQTKDPAQRLGVARVLESLGYPEEAEPYYVGVARELKASRPLAVLPLVGYYGRRKEVAKALKLVEEIHGKPGVPDVVLIEAWVGVLRDGHPTQEEHYRRVERWLQAAKRKAPTETAFDLGLANLKDLQGLTDEAVAIYEDVLERDKANLLAYNNLAVLLAMRGRGGERALGYMEKALELGGRRPDLLDSRGIVYLSMKQYRKAIDDLSAAVQMTPDPASYFRLATAYLGEKELSRAKEAYNRAKANGFKPDDLHPLEREKGKETVAALEKE